MKHSYLRVHQLHKENTLTMLFNLFFEIKWNFHLQVNICNCICWIILGRVVFPTSNKEIKYARSYETQDEVPFCLPSKVRSGVLTVDLELWHWINWVNWGIIPFTLKLDRQCLHSFQIFCFRWARDVNIWNHSALACSSSHVS